MDTKERIDNILNNLYSGGGVGQCRSLLYCLLDSGDIKTSDVFDTIENIIITKKRCIENFIIPIDRCDYLYQNGEKLACLDKDLKFCVAEKGTPEWDNVAFVMPHYDVNKATSLICSHNRCKEANVL